MEVIYCQGSYSVKGQYTVTSELVKLLDYCPDFMKEDILTDRVKHTLQWVLSGYGYILPGRISPRTQSLHISEFADLICEHHCQETPQNRYAVQFLRLLA